MKRFHNILCVMQIGVAYQPALERAVTVAENNGASLTVINIVETIAPGTELPEGGPTSSELQDAMERDHAQGLEILVGPYRERVQIETKILKGTPFLEIIREVLRNGRDLVMKVPDTQHWLDRLFGSDDMHLLRKCPCPVWLIKATTPNSYRRILAAVDVDDVYPPEELKSRHALNKQILEMAYSLALSDFTELHIVHAWEAMGENAVRGELLCMPDKKIHAYVEKVRQHRAARLSALMSEISSLLGQDVRKDFKPRPHLVKGLAAKEIPELARRIEADLVLMGTVARTGVSGFIIGNTAETILNQIDCSVLAIKPPGFVTPVTLKA